MGKPRLILIIRHAQSEGNKDKTIHQGTPDHKVGLTEEGHEQARQAGDKLRQLLRKDDSLHFFISPYRRTRETTEGILSGLCSNEPAPSPFQRSHIKVYEEPRLREQDFGNFQPGPQEVERLWRERANYGHFFYRIPNGESGADVYDRITSFNGSLWRRFSEDEMSSVAVLVTHGLCSRVFLMAWYHYSVEFFEDLRNINHCEFLVMKLGGNGRYVLQNELRTWTDLKRERASRKSIVAAPTSPKADSGVPRIPVRRWASQRSGFDATGSTAGKKPPVRRGTADMFNDEDEREEDIESGAGRECPPDEEENAVAKPSLSTSPDNARNAQFQKKASPLQNRLPSSRGGLKAYLGRDGGGSKSGAASPLTSDEEPSLNTPSVTQETESMDPSKQSFQPSSLAKALRGDFGGPDRVMADALGDQSDAEVDEADLEMGTKEKKASELEHILEEERRDRSHTGSKY